MCIHVYVYVLLISVYLNYVQPGAYERREAAQRSIKLQYVSGSISCRITPLQTALYGKPL